MQKRLDGSSMQGLFKVAKILINIVGTGTKEKIDKTPLAAMFSVIFKNFTDILTCLNEKINVKKS